MEILGMIFLCACSCAIGWMMRDLDCGCRLLRKTHGRGYQPTQHDGDRGAPPPAE